MIPKIKVLALDLQRWGAQFSPLHLILTFIFLISPNRGIDIIVLLEAPDGLPNLSGIVFAPSTTRRLARRMVRKLSLRTRTSECIGKPDGFLS